MPGGFLLGSIQGEGLAGRQASNGEFWKFRHRGS
jgi:hypothetical protein